MYQRCERMEKKKENTLTLLVFDIRAILIYQLCTDSLSINK